MGKGVKGACVSRVAGAVVVLAVAVVPAAAAAEAQGEAGAHPELLGAFRLRGTHGFEILGLPFSGGGERPSGITLFIDKPGESVVYAAPAEASRTTVKADLGPIGEIDLRLVPTGTEKTARSSCGGKTYHYEGEAFEGTIDLHGEEGFTEVEATRTPLLIDPILHILCAGPALSEVGGAGLPGARLRVRKKAEQQPVSLQLNQNRPHGPVSFEAGIEERRGPLRITRALSGDLPGGSFSYTGDLTEARFRAAGPFSGRAAYRASAGGGRWTGDLTVDFPGRSGVELTGSRFTAVLSHARRTQSQAPK